MYLHLDQLLHLLLILLVTLVQEHHNAGHAYLLGQQNVFARLGHGAV